MKKIIILVILGLIVIYALIFSFKYIYVPKGQEFDIKYTNLQRTGKVGGAQEEKAELTDHGFETRSNFQKSGDALEYTFDVVNDGTINAKLKMDPIYLKADMYLKKHIKYQITYTDGTEVKKNDELNAGETKTMKVKFTYENDADLATVDSQFYETNVYLLYLQNR